MPSLGFIHSSQFLNLWHMKIYRECLLTRILICQVVKLQGQIVKIKMETRGLKSKNHPNFSTQRKFITSILKFTPEAFLLYIFTWLRSNYGDHILNESQQRNTQVLHGRRFIGTVPASWHPRSLTWVWKKEIIAQVLQQRKWLKYCSLQNTEEKNCFV